MKLYTSSLSLIQLSPQGYLRVGRADLQSCLLVNPVVKKNTQNSQYYHAPTDCVPTSTARTRKLNCIFKSLLIILLIFSSLEKGIRVRETQPSLKKTRWYKTIEIQSHRDPQAELLITKEGSQHTWTQLHITLTSTCSA